MHRQLKLFPRQNHQNVPWTFLFRSESVFQKMTFTVLLNFKTLHMMLVTRFKFAIDFSSKNFSFKAWWKFDFSHISTDNVSHTIVFEKT